MTKYKPGDRVYVMPESHSENGTGIDYCGKVCVIDFINGYEVRLSGNYVSPYVSSEHIVLESVYNSPLWKALNEGK